MVTDGNLSWITNYIWGIADDVSLDLRAGPVPLVQG